MNDLLPILVAGLVEARLERYDNLIVAGLNESNIPQALAASVDTAQPAFDAFSHLAMGLYSALMTPR